jgi:hypothetical protein
MIGTETYETPFGTITASEAAFAFAVVDILSVKRRARPEDLLEALLAPMPDMVPAEW